MLVRQTTALVLTLCIDVYRPECIVTSELGLLVSIVFKESERLA